MKKRRRSLGNQQGMVLIAVLALVVAATVSVVEIQRQSRKALIQGAALQERYQLLEMATSAIHYGMAVLAEDKRQTNADTLSEPWADTQRLSAWLNRSVFPSAKTRLWITDEQSKIQVNAIADAAQPDGIDPVQRRLWDGHFDWFRVSITNSLPG